MQPNTYAMATVYGVRQKVYIIDIDGDVAHVTTDRRNGFKGSSSGAQYATVSVDELQGVA